ncbi:MAG: hypothetical protein QOH93_1947 [Chloroflexia bacterium]|nr:hypothetical protein [Chloroflexia bacterium]
MKYTRGDLARANALLEKWLQVPTQDKRAVALIMEAI